MTLLEFNIKKPKILPSEFLHVGWIKYLIAVNEQDWKKYAKQGTSETISPDDVDANSPDACAWCAIGAFCAALDIRSDYGCMSDKYHELFRFLHRLDTLKNLGFYEHVDDDDDEGWYNIQSLIGYNDEEAKSLEDILEIVESIELHLGWR